MNQLEHLKALRDKARIQTEQAEAVLKQQGEISESLDKLIAALEETDEGAVPGIDKISLSEASGAALAAVGVPPLAPKSDGGISGISDKEGDSVDESADPEGEGVVESLGQLLANLEENPDNESGSGPVDAIASNLDVSETGSEEVVAGEESDEDQDSAEWVSEESDSREDDDDTVTPPRLEPIVWEVSDATPVAGGDQAEADDTDEADVTVPSMAVDESSGDETSGGDYKFVKLGGESDTETSEEEAEVSDQADDSDDDSKGIAPLAGLAAAGTAAVAGAAHLLGGDDSKDEDGLIDRIKEKGENWKDDLKDKAGDTVDTIKEEIGIGEKEDLEVNASDATAPVPPLPSSLGIEPVAASVNEVEETLKEVADNQDESDTPPPVSIPVGTPPPPIPVSSDTPPPPIAVPSTSPPPPIPVRPIAVPPAAASGLAGVPPVPQPESEPETEPVAAVEPKPAVAAPVEDSPFEGAHSSNIFFDANSAYLKESELTKLKAIADAVAGSEARLVKIQGLEDLASSNDFKELLASRRLLAVRKRLAEHGLEESQLTVGEIKLSDEGRVLEPPSISMVPA